MNFIKRQRRFFAILFLLITVVPIVHPIAVNAWTIGGGPHQPEYTSFEESGSTDMVNLLNGDFTYSLPILEVPGPEGSYSVPLTYNAGIGNDQESSWVGLGWTLNAGAITRQINEYPDDSDGNIQSVTVQNLNGIKGWFASLPGGSQIGWNNVQGHSGTISLFGVLNASYDEEHLISSFNVLGINPHNGTIDVNEQELFTGIGTIAGLGSNDAGLRMQNIKLVAFGTTISTLGAMTAKSSMTYTDAGSGNWAYNKRSQSKGTLGLWTDYHVWLDQTRLEGMFGTIYLGDATSEPYSSANMAVKAQTNGGTLQVPNRFHLDAANVVGTATDINYYIPSQMDFMDVISPAVLANDNYTVKAPGITGSISPYRLEVGSVSLAREMSGDHVRLQLLPYLNNYKTPFVYEGDSYNYLYHNGNSTPAFNFGLSATSTNWEADLAITDNIFGAGSRVRADVANQAQPKLPQANHIEWVSNYDIANTVFDIKNGTVPGGVGIPNYNFTSWANPVAGGVFSNGFMDYFSDPNSRIQYRYGLLGFDFPNGNSVLNGIGGYAITGANGLTYHFALPVLDNNYSVQITNSDNSVNSTISRNGAFANTWLLTGITGPDFVDRNSNGAIDETDWGYWIKFNYQLYASLPWSIPQTGTLPDPTNSNVSSKISGSRQQYYLNSIETRSHVALFLKDADYNKIGYETSPRLEEIVLLKREDYNVLLASPYNMQAHSGTVASACFLYQFYTNSNIATPNAAGVYLNSHAIRKIRFNHTYNLRSTNSQVANQGKRTLMGVSIMGRNETKVLPDYKFEYGPNPDYDPNKWDAWGMYNSQAYTGYHYASTLDADGAAWSLNRITTPLGSTIDVAYERDTYSSISGMDALGEIWYPTFQYDATNISSPTSVTMPSGFNSVPGNTLNAGDLVYMDGKVTYTCLGNNFSLPVSINLTVQSVSGTTVTFMSSYKNANVVCSGGSATNVIYSGKLYKRDIKKGGGIRVASLTLTDQGTQYKSRYLYSLDDGRSSGVIAQEPPFAVTNSFDFNTMPGYPMTPIMYSRVSVLSGKLTTDTDFSAKTVYEFETPNINMLSSVSDYSHALNSPSYVDIPGSCHLCQQYIYANNQISDYTSKLGAIKSIKVYDVSDLSNPVSATTMSYTNQILNAGGTNNYQGLFSSGTLMHDVFVNYQKVKMIRTTTIKYPYTLQKVVSQKDGFTIGTDNLAWDFISGQVLEKNSISALGLKTKTVIQPAYTVASYSQMGPKAYNSSNKNMLAQTAGEYVYRLDAFGNISGLISGVATTWKSDWNNYRYLSGGTYMEDGNEPGLNPNVWRRNKTYVYKGNVSDLQSDGSRKIATFNKFDFGQAATNTGWAQNDEITRYDHYSLPVETKDIVSGIYSSVKTNINNKQILASASNANYYEFAYSGAEDFDNTSGFFGGEISLNPQVSPFNTTPATVVSGPAIIPGTQCHTGQAAVQVSSGNKSLIYKPKVLTSGRTYRAQVWASSTNGAIYYSINGVEQSIPLNFISVKQVGTWSRIVVENIPSTATEIGVKATNGAVVYFDDFKFQPSDGAVTASVYDLSTGYLTYTIANDNTYIRYCYDDRGIVMKAYAESIKYNGERLVSERKDDYKRKYINP